MKIRVKFLASLYELTGVLKMELDVPDGISIKELISLLSMRYRNLETEILDETGNLKPMYNILVNGRAIEWLNGLATKLKDGDEVVFIPPAAGG